jgi:hypothetical protein
VCLCVYHGQDSTRPPSDPPRLLSPPFPCTCRVTADLWDTHDDCKNWGVLRGHKNAILEVHWTDEGRFVELPRPANLAQPPRTSKRWPHRRDAVSHRVMVRVHHLQLPRASPLPAAALQPCTLPGALPHAAAVDALHCMRCAPPFILFLHASPQKTVLSFILTLRPSTFPFLCLRQRRGSRAFIFQGCPCVPCRCPSISLLIILLIS